jgi:hypothetical protein
MKVRSIVLQEVRQSPPYTAVMALEYHIRLDTKEVPSCLVTVLLRVAAIRTSKVV